MPKGPQRPPLWFVQVRGIGIIEEPKLADPVPVRDLAEALRTAEHRFDPWTARARAGASWWLLAAWTAAAAALEARHLGRRRHARQADFSAAHKLIRVGLDPGLDAIRDVDPAAHVPRCDRNS